MTYYAKIENGKVTQVIICGPKGIKNYKGRWIETFKNNPDKIFAGIGMNYNSVKKIFHADKPFPSWKMKPNGIWEAPIQPIRDGKHKTWNESKKKWINDKDRSSI